MDKWGNEKSEVIDSTSLNDLALDISNATSSSKLKYHERLTNKLNDPKTFPKTYLAILKAIVNDSRIPMIPPLLVYNKLVTEFWIRGIDLIISVLNNPLVYITAAQFL